jgi:CHAT domain-containing protein
MVRGQRWIGLVLAVAGWVNAAAARQQVQPGLSAEQLELLRERDHHAADARKLRAEGKLPEAAMAAERALAAARKALGHDHEDVILSLGILAELYVEQEAFPAAQTAYQDALATKTKLPGVRPWELTDIRLALEDVKRLAGLKPEQRIRLAQAKQEIGQVEQLRRQRKLRQALFAVRTAQAIREGIFEKEHPDYIQCLEELANLYFDLGDFRRAELYYRNATDLWRNALGADHPHYAQCLHNLSLLCENLQDFAGAVRYGREALAVKKQALGEADTAYRNTLKQLVGTLGKWAGQLEDQEDFPSARKIREEELDHTIQLFGQADWRSTDARLALADIGRLVELSPAQRQRLRESHRIMEKVATLEKLEMFSEAIPFAKMALATREELLGKGHRLSAASLSYLGFLYAFLRDYDRAEPLVRTTSELVRDVLGERHPRYALNLRELAALNEARGDYAGAELRLRQVCEIYRAAGHPDYPRSMAELVSFYDRAARARQADGKVAGARQFRAKALTALMASPDKKDWQVREARLALADAERLAGMDTVPRQRLASASRLLSDVEDMRGRKQFREALESATKAAGIRAELLGTNHPDFADALSCRADQARSLGAVAEAEMLYGHASGIYEQALGKDHPTFAASLGKLTDLYAEIASRLRQEERFPEAQAVLRKAMTLLHQQHGSQHWELTDAQLSLDDVVLLTQLDQGHRQSLRDADRFLQQAAALRAQHKFREAIHCIEEALSIRKTILGERNKGTAVALNNLGFLYYTLGDYARAEPLYQQALAVRKEVFGEAHFQYARSLHNYANLLYDLGEYGDAELYLKEALHIFRRTFGEEDSDYLGSLNSLGTLYLAADDRARAEPVLLDAARLRKSLLGQENADYARSLNNLAGLYSKSGDVDLAESLFVRASGVWKARKEYLDYARSQDNLADICSSRKDYAGAEKHILEAQRIFKRLLMDDHRDYAINLHHLAALYQATDRPAEALAVMGQAMEVEQVNVRRVFGFTGEHTMQAFLGRISYSLDGLVSLAVAEDKGEGPAVAAVLSWTLRRKAVVLDTLCRYREAQRLVERNEGVAERVRNWRTLRQRIADLALDPDRADRPDEAEREIRSLRTEADRQEAELNRALAELHSEQLTDLNEVDIGALRARLPAGAALVELLRVRPFDFKAAGNRSRRKQARYIALVLTAAGGSPRLIDLKEAAAIDGAANELRQEWDRAERTLTPKNESVLEGEFRNRSTRLYHLVFEPLKEALGTSTLVYLAPEGTLNLVPFEALTDETGQYLIERYRFAYVASGREVLRRPAKTRQARGAVIFAGPNFNLGAAARAARVRELLPPGHIPEGRLETGSPARNEAGSLTDIFAPRQQGRLWRPLKDAAREAGLLKSALEEGGYGPVREYVGDDALEEVLKDLHGPRVLHLATHGFDRPYREPEPGTQRSLLDGMEDPLLRSGVVLVGANTLAENAPARAQDGWVTAEEIALLDLQGTELAVMGACETGIGDVRAGEGVFGVRRAFAYAGARTLVMSLFQVPEEETNALLRLFFRYLKLSAGKLDALHRAKVDAIGRRRAAKNAAHPFFWAGFVLAGDPA